MKAIRSLAILGLLGTVAPWASANQEQIAYARVIQAQPVYEWVERRQPETQCWIETVRHEHSSHRQATPTVLGGVIGGALGHAVGHGHKNKKIGTAVGALLGAAIGSDLERNRRHTKPHAVRYQEVERCETHDRVSTIEQLVGYDVTYQYNGQRYTTRMHTPPGDRIRVAVQVRPLDR